MDIDVRRGQGNVKLSREEFERRLRQRFYDPAFEEVSAEIDRETGFQEETRNAARTLVEAVKLSRAGQLPRPDRHVHPPRPK